MKETAVLRRRILSRRASLAVVGQGYMGLSLACAAADAGFPVTAIDADQSKIRELRAGALAVPGVSDRAFRAALASQHLTFSALIDSVEGSDIVSICVPIPIRDQSPELSYLEQICREVGRRLRPGQLVILESSAFPGTTEDLVRPALEISGLHAGRDFLLAYAPERLDPGTEDHSLQNTPRIVGGTTREATGVAALFYGQFVDKVVQVSNCRTAELAKFLENVFRHVNVALVNEMSVFCHQAGMDVWEVVEAAGTKPFGFMPFYPGPGIGGHSFPLSRSAPQKLDTESPFRMLEQARDVNARMPGYVASRIVETLSAAGKEASGARILILGVAYKSDIGDVLESPAVKVIADLRRRGAKVGYHDPYISELSLNGDLLGCAQLTERLVEAADCVALLTPHTAYDLDWIARHASLVFDTRNAYGPDRRPNVVPL
jgi:UDP-N-acetyl-D-glucosamine dehydrogenase